MATRKTSPKPTRSSKTATKAKSTTKATPKSKSTAVKAKASTKTKASKAKPAASKTQTKAAQTKGQTKSKPKAKKATTTKAAAKKVTTKATTKKRVAKSEELEVATISRRRENRRTSSEVETTAKKTTKPAAEVIAAEATTKPVAKKEAAPTLERREKVNRRRQIDPTTCERDYSDLEVEFMNALDVYKRTSGRMFPTCSEVLEVIRDLGYSKLTPMELAARKALEPIVDVEGDDLEASVEADANEALEESFGFQSADEESFDLV